MPHQSWPRQGEWTVEAMWELLPDDGNRYEVIDGVLHVSPSPGMPHQDAVGTLYHKLRTFLELQTIGWAYIAPSDVVFTPHRGVQPDVYVAPLVAGRRPRRTDDVTHLMLAIEVLSPSTADYDRNTKRQVYQQHADEYLIVDLDARHIERWRPGDERPEILDTTLEWRPAGADAPLTLDLPAFFRDVLES